MISPKSFYSGMFVVLFSILYLAGATAADLTSLVINNDVAAVRKQVDLLGADLSGTSICADYLASTNQFSDQKCGNC